MNEKIYKKICSLILENGSWYLYDCSDNKLKQLSEEGNFPYAMKRNYLNKRKGRIDISTVWVLVGFTDDKEVYEQVGRTKDLINSLNEIRENVKDFYNNEDGKYGVLKKREYKKIVFYEVDIDKYIETDELFLKTYGEPPKDEFLSLAYYFIRAAYVEGKLGSVTCASMYHKSSLDEYFYSYYDNQKQFDRSKELK